MSLELKDREIFEQMFAAAGVDKGALHAALVEMGASNSNAPKLWTAERPSIGYGAVVSEMVYCYYPLIPLAIPITMKANDGTVHRVLGYPAAAAKQYPKEKILLASVEIDNRTSDIYMIIDLTADQFDERFNYHFGKRQLFGYPSPSRRAQTLAALMGRDTVLRQGHKWK